MGVPIAVERHVQDEERQSPEAAEVDADPGNRGGATSTSEGMYDGQEKKVK